MSLAGAVRVGRGKISKLLVEEFEARSVKLELASDLPTGLI